MGLKLSEKYPQKCISQMAGLMLLLLSLSISISPVLVLQAQCIIPLLIVGQLQMNPKQTGPWMFTSRWKTKRSFALFPPHSFFTSFLTQRSFSRVFERLLKSRSTFDADNLHRNMTCFPFFCLRTMYFVIFLSGGLVVLIKDLKIWTKSASF